MNKPDLLKSIAEKGYDVGFGAKKHFATYDIIEKAPGIAGFCSMAFGIFSLALNDLPSELMSAIFIIIGIIALYINFYNTTKQDYEKSGVALTKIFNELKTLYLSVRKVDDDNDLSAYLEKLQEIDGRYYPLCISKQILFSNWYAHYKFFWEHQIDWIDKELNFKFFRDKVPLSLWFTLIFGTIGVGVWAIYMTTSICGICTN